MSTKALVEVLGISKANVPEPSLLCEPTEGLRLVGTAVLHSKDNLGLSATRRGKKGHEHLHEKSGWSAVAIQKVTADNVLKGPVLLHDLPGRLRIREGKLEETCGAPFLTVPSLAFCGILLRGSQCGEVPVCADDARAEACECDGDNPATPA